MAVAIVQSSALGLTQGAQSLSLTLSGVTAGNAIVITLAQYSTTANDAPVIKDGTTTLSQEIVYTPGGNYSVACVGWELNVAAGSHTVTVNTASNNTGAFMDAKIHEVSGLGSTQPRVFASNTITTGTTLSISGGTANSGDIVFTVWAPDANVASSTGAATIPTGYTSLWTEFNGASYQIGAAAYEILSATGSLSLSWTGLNGGGTNDMAAIAVVLEAAGASTNNATLAAGLTFGASIQATQTLSSAIAASADPGARILTAQTNAATLQGYASPGFASTVTQTNVLNAALAAGVSPGAAMQLVQTLSAAVTAHAQPGVLIGATQTNAATLQGYASPGFAANVIQTNAVRAAIAAGIQPGVVVTAFQNYLEAAMRFACQQAGVPQFYTGIKPPIASFQIFQSSGSWTVPSGTSSVMVSATAAGGTPLGTSGRQAIQQTLPVVTGDVLTVSIGPNVTISKGSTILLSLLDGGPYSYGLAQGQNQDSGIAGFGSGVLSGPAYPALVVFLWR